MARLYANENLPEPVALELRRLGHDVVTMRESGHAGRSMADRDVLEFATQNGRCVVTLNRRHFVRLHGADPNHAGIVVCTFDADLGALARRIHESIVATPSLTGVLVRVNRPA
jgi:predicted nuclease of predicted toxin-antitoxin system